MGDTIWVDVRGRLKDDDLPPDSSFMLRFRDELDSVAAKLGVPKLSEFYDYSVLEEEADEFLDERDDEEEAENASDGADSLPEKGSWFDAAKGLAAVRAIRAHLDRHPAELGSKREGSAVRDGSAVRWSVELMDELKRCEEAPEAAVSGGKDFRFLIVP